VDRDLRVRDGGQDRARVIRASGREEFERHFEIQRAASLAALAHVYPPDRYPFPDDDVRRRWREFPGNVLAAELDGDVVGVAAVDDCWLEGFYVLPERWGTGIAAELHDAALAELADCPEIRLWTLEENHRARRFYEKRGWRLNGETRVVPFPPNPLDVGYSYIREEP
jgi:putative acetyltransferase